MSDTWTTSDIQQLQASSKDSVACSALDCKVFTLVGRRALFKPLLWLSPTHTPSPQTNDSALREIDLHSGANKTLKRDSSDLKVEASQAFRALSLLRVGEGHGWKGKQPLLNKPLKHCPLYLGFIICVVNPLQPSSFIPSVSTSQGWEHLGWMTNTIKLTADFFLNGLNKTLC